MKRIFRLIYVLPMMLLFGCTEDLSELADGSFTGTSSSSYNNYNRPYTAVDLGLSVKWGEGILNESAKSNYSYYHLNAYRYFSFGAEKDDLTREPTTNGNITGTRFDQATKSIKAPWRTPTKEEFQELFSKCKLEISEQDNYRGVLVTGPNGKTIFIRANDNTSTSIDIWTSSFKSTSSEAEVYYYVLNLYDIQHKVVPELKTTSYFYSTISYSSNIEDRVYYKGNTYYATNRLICPVQN